MCSLINPFVIHYLESIKASLDVCKNLNCQACLCSLARWSEPYLVANHKDRFVGAQWLSGRVLKFKTEGPRVRASLRCVLEQGTLILA